MAQLHDTIAALATPTGTSALAVLRISGSDTEKLTRAIVGATPPPRTAQRADYRDRDGRLLDDVLCTFFRGPASYTGEDTLEISCHGNPYIAQRILGDLIARGCRQAEPGEFTQRAFLNGQLDLSQAEAVMDLIHARGEKALAAANQQLRGALGRHMAGLIEDLLGVLARIEAYIDFPEEDLPAEDQSRVVADLESLKISVSKLLSTNHYGTILREGVKVAILGEPNAGKSSLLNRLLGRERALVSDRAGTTRDYLEERILLGDYCLRLIDTAGLNPTPEEIERQGIAKTLEILSEADLVLLLLDGTRPFPPLPVQVISSINPTRTLLVLNKSDLPAVPGLDACLPDFERIAISALTGAGLDRLQTALIARAQAFHVELGDEIIAINARHAEALTRAGRGLEAALEKLKLRDPIELISSDLRETLAAFGDIAGKIDNERMLDRLFASFCIGK
ncbi:MAG: tRNA uridine-5-carboxymethylaminomethyl(34) synthesis GTPase MnmE [Opitutaceae bacterium]|nr:tRNA uridine-5-carboxymethylaminomethyl(34) synthesis GTPase MnmE [Opitutaceae bacterium]